MANGIATELSTRGYEPRDSPCWPTAARSVACLRHRFRAGRQQGAGTAVLVDLLGLRRRHREPDAHPRDEHLDRVVQSEYAQLATSTPSTAASRNWSGAGARTWCARARPGTDPLPAELDMRYGNQRVQTAVVTPLARLRSQRDVLQLMELFHARYGERFGEGSQSPETGVRINTLRVCAYVEQPSVRFASLAIRGEPLAPPEPVAWRECHFVGHDAPLQTAVYDDRARTEGTQIDGPAVITTRATTYPAEPGWTYRAVAQGGARSCAGRRRTTPCARPCARRRTRCIRRCRRRCPRRRTRQNRWRRSSACHTKAMPTSAPCSTNSSPTTRSSSAGSRDHAQPQRPAALAACRAAPRPRPAPGPPCARPDQRGPVRGLHHGQPDAPRRQVG